MLKRGAGRLLTLFLAVAASIGVVGVLGLLTSIPFAVLVVILQRVGRGTSVWAPVAVVGVLSSFAVCLAFALRFFLISEAVMLEDCGAIEALKRSKQLMVDHSPKGLLAVESHSLRLSAILLLVLALGLLAYVVSRLPFAVIAVAGMLARGGDIGSLIDAPSVFPPAAEFAGVVASSLVQPVGISAIVLFYYDLRIRTEGFDLDVLAHEITSKSG